ncbi:hypothetical protein IQ268_07965 [Oculatella sp. LEGE 06141]|nr:hypothetical protein [Oculatella sp. LEGE 06141]
MAATSNNHHSGHPRYELRAESLGSSNLQLEVWQLPSMATPQIVQPVRVAGLKGRNLALIENRILRRLAKADVSMGGLKPGKPKTYALDEEVALVFGLIFRVLAPMRSRDNMLACIEGIEAMSREEAAYWLGMAMHRKNPRRVLMSLRILLTDPHR